MSFNGYRPKGWTTQREADCLYVVARRSEAGMETTADDIATELRITRSAAVCMLNRLRQQHRLREQRSYTITPLGTRAIGAVMLR